MVNFLVFGYPFIFSCSFIEAGNDSNISSIFTNTFNLLPKSSKRIHRNEMDESLLTSQSNEFNLDSEALYLPLKTDIDNNNQMMRIDSFTQFKSSSPRSLTNFFFEKRIIQYGFSLDEILSEFGFIPDITENIVGYVYINSVQDSYDQIIGEFRKENLISPHESLMSVEFNNSNELKAKLLDNEFMIKFSILTGKFSVRLYEPFGNYLSTFVLKSFLIMRQKYPNIHGQDQEKWEEIVKNMEMLESISKINLWNFTDILEWNLGFPGIEGPKLFNLECLRRWKDDLEPRFKGLLDDFYSVENGSCLAIISKHFNGVKEISLNARKLFKNFKSYLNKDPLLAFLWKYQDYNSWKKCFYPSRTLDSSYLNTKEEMENFKLKRNRILTLSFEFIPLSNLESDLKLVMENNHKINFNSSNLSDQHFFEMANILKGINRFTEKDSLNIIKILNSDENLSHSKLESLFEAKIKSFVKSNPSLYDRAMQLIDGYRNDLNN